MTLHGSNACLAVPSGSLADRSVHSAEREALILAALRERGFVSYRSLKNRLAASPATIRRDLLRLQDAGHIARVHGGAKIPGQRMRGPPATGAQKGSAILCFSAGKPRFRRSASGALTCADQVKRSCWARERPRCRCARISRE